MRFLRKAAGLLLAAVITLGCTAGYAAPPIVTAAASTARPGAAQSGYTRWTGSTKPAANKNYYIDGKVQIKRGTTVIFPAGSKLELRKGAELQVYVGSTLQIRGDVEVQEGAKLTVSGTLILSAGSKLENSGNVSTTKSSTVRISSTFNTADKGTVSFGGEVLVYMSGLYKSSGKTTLTANSDTKITGGWNTLDGGQLFAKGKLSVTLSGKLIQSGDLCLYSRLVNSGKVTLNYGSKYMKSQNAVLALTKSGRVVDNRYSPPPESTRPDPPDLGENVKLRGIDVSSWQDTIDWKRVKQSGVDFAILRSSFYVRKDRMFEYNIEEAQKAGVMVGVYHYCYATTVLEAREEARYFLSVIAPYEIDFPVILDFEDPSQEDLGKDKLTTIAKAFLDEVKNAGYYTMLYANKHWMTKLLDMNRLSEYDVWLAEWRTAPTYSGNFGIWQYTSEGRVAGIRGDVDLNICYRDYYKIIEDGGYKR
ncbi:MAG: glycoside hydrolase family 25 protein [Oscillospiraceae bacterium]|nr:glycoside hydrolase family 25 protein [Oscillospiraceae bacterium]